MKKSILTVFLSIILIFNMIACGDGSTTAEATDTAKNVTEKNQPEEATFAPAAKSVPKKTADTGEVVFEGPDSKNIQFYEIPEGTTKIGDHAFEDCLLLDSVSIPNTVKEIGKRAFANCPKLQDIEIPSSVEIIGGSAFADCTYLTTVKLNDGLKTIGENAFGRCRFRLKSIEIPSSVETIGSRAFYECNNLISVKFNEGLKTIKDNAFCDTSLGYTEDEEETPSEPLIIPESVTTIEGGAFSGTCIQFVKLPSTLTKIAPGTFFGTCLKSVDIPDTVVEIGDDAFGYCRDLTNVTIPNSVKKIGKEAFCATNLSTIVIPNSVTALGENAFSNDDIVSGADKRTIAVTQSLLDSLNVRPDGFVTIYAVSPNTTDIQIYE